MHVLCGSEKPPDLVHIRSAGMGQHLNLASKGQAIWMLLKKNPTNIRFGSPCDSQRHQVIWKRSSEFKMCRCFRFKAGICLCRHTLCSKKPQRTTNRFYGAVSARALSFVIVLHQVMRKLVTSSVPCRGNPQYTILHSLCSIHIYLFFVCVLLSELLWSS